MLILVVDTNLFHEFRPLKELPWAELGEIEDIILIVSEVVQTELDEHKKSTRTRLKRTAIKVTKQFRDIILVGQDDMIIQETAPRVVLRLDDTSFGSDTYDGILDLSVLDDQLVGIAKRLADQSSNGSVRLFSDDIRPLRKAKAVRLEIMPIPEAWRRKAELTDEDKERNRLQKENKRLKSQEPILSLSSEGPNPLNKVLPLYSALDDNDIDRLMKTIRGANPKETNFERQKTMNPHHTFLGGGTPGISQYRFEPAKVDAIEQYKETEYPDWEEACRQTLKDAHKKLRSFYQRFEVEIRFRNSGTRPAEDVLFTVQSKGALVVMPSASGDVDEEQATPLRFPSVPPAPQGKWKRYDPVGSLLVNMNHGMFGTPMSTSVLSPLLNQTQRERDPNCFYYRDRPNYYVREYALTCKQFRHAGGAVSFLCQCSIDVAADCLDGKSAMLEILVEAANLSDPVRMTIPIKFSTEVMSTYNAVMDIIKPNILGLKIDQSD